MIGPDIGVDGLIAADVIRAKIRRAVLIEKLVGNGDYIGRAMLAAKSPLQAVLKSIIESFTGNFVIQGHISSIAIHARRQCGIMSI